MHDAYFNFFSAIRVELLAHRGKLRKRQNGKIQDAMSASCDCLGEQLETRPTQNEPQAAREEENRCVERGRGWCFV